MNRTVNATIIALYAAAMPLLAGLSDDTLNRLAGFAGLDAGITSNAVISEDDAVTLALAATIANHRPSLLKTFSDHPDAETVEVIEVMASLN
jgi:hypothetical protein